MKTIQKNYDSNTMLSYVYFVISILLMMGFYQLVSSGFPQFVSEVSYNTDGFSVMSGTD